MIDKYGVLVVNETGYDYTNIGDYIQALASSQFVPQIDQFVDRERLAGYEGPEVKVIMNAWYMYNEKQWPPSPHIHPLFISMHINKSAYHIFSTQESIAYLKKYEPIGCRDKSTETFLTDLGVKAYFSGCMTLTLGFKYKTNEVSDKVYFVDPAVPKIGDAFNQLRLLFKALPEWKKINFLYKKKYPNSKSFLSDRHRFLATVSFLREYRKIFDEQMILDAEYITQQGHQYYTIPTDKERLFEAERLIKLYAKAKLVITSRIHCALPCTGLETPVIYTFQDAQDEDSSCRMSGLIELFNVVHISKGGKIIPFGNYDNTNKISDINVPKPKNSWKSINAALISSCSKFIQGN